MEHLRRWWAIVVDAAYGWINDDAMSMAASIAFYTIFSLAPLAILVIALAGLVFGDEAARGALVDQLSALVGREAGQTLQDLIARAGARETGLVASIIGIGTIIVGATTVFVELQTALNRIWKVAAPQESTITWLVRVRLKALALIGAIGFLLIVSLVVSAALAAVGTWATGWAAGYLPAMPSLLWLFDMVVSWTVLTGLFAMIYRILPDTRIRWTDVWLGAAVNAFLFAVGKFLIGFYIATSGVVTVYGAAGSFVLILLWVYYSAVIFLFGAELTRAYSERKGSRSHRPPIDRPATDGSATGRSSPAPASSGSAVP
ncbi:YihY/virulence factor BrkB family protein [Azospirillum sp. INR13]|uniref:YihY/virulence factor BrkB family protein n=1 Tax=Azospirillum sp. INR13 TaxID=2596919 RepID=UPI0018922E5F|nr:YihY/virulence factor BrkB family protein [Azospirillum sp. INR13]MBF5095986.1 YihY/virulence factor BrkB family protein [Azospirillum sp. INR13]